MTDLSSSTNRLRAQIAATAAAIIVKESAPWSVARMRALEDAGVSARASNSTPSAEEIESAVREHFAIFAPDTHRTELALQRGYALKLLEDLAEFDAYLAGAVLNGAANPSSNIKIEIFCDDAKSVEIRLMELGLDFEAIEEEGGLMPSPEESLGFLSRVPGLPDLQGVRIDIYSTRRLGLNPYKRKPDAHQKEWEAAGRLNAAHLRQALGA